MRLTSRPGAHTRRTCSATTCRPSSSASTSTERHGAGTSRTGRTRDRHLEVQHRHPQVALTQRHLRLAVVDERLAVHRRRRVDAGAFGDRAGRTTSGVPERRHVACRARRSPRACWRSDGFVRVGPALPAPPPRTTPPPGSRMMLPARLAVPLDACAIRRRLLRRLRLSARRRAASRHASPDTPPPRTRTRS